MEARALPYHALTIVSGLWCLGAAIALPVSHEDRKQLLGETLFSFCACTLIITICLSSFDGQYMSQLNTTLHNITALSADMHLNAIAPLEELPDDLEKDDDDDDRKTQLLFVLDGLIACGGIICLLATSTALTMTASCFLITVALICHHSYNRICYAHTYIPTNKLFLHLGVCIVSGLTGGVSMMLRGTDGLDKTSVILVTAGAVCLSIWLSTSVYILHRADQEDSHAILTFKKLLTSLWATALFLTCIAIVIIISLGFELETSRIAWVLLKGSLLGFGWCVCTLSVCAFSPFAILRLLVVPVCTCACVFRWYMLGLEPQSLVKTLAVLGAAGIVFAIINFLALKSKNVLWWLMVFGKKGTLLQKLMGCFLQLTCGVLHIEDPRAANIEMAGLLEERRERRKEQRAGQTLPLTREKATQTEINEFDFT